jgi:pyruvate dehydrogenase E1 component alpha subunit
MHLFSKAHGILGSNGIVGGGLSLAIGAALHAKIQKTGQISVCFFGDGASNEGIFQESINLAAVLKLPVIFVCENNLYATETPISSATLSKNIADRAAAFGLPGVIADGNDVVDVYQKASAAAERARNGEGPTLLENKTYRTCGHYVGHMETGYRPKEELQAWKDRDPILLFATRLTDAGVVTEAAMAAMDAAIVEEFEAGMAFADASPSPAAESVTEFLLA